jgi:trans-aconitate 2-methyltransferase
VVDLGCGPGNLTALLKQRWPDAKVTGVDSSPEMIAAANPAGGVEYTVGDLRQWHPEAPVDVLVSNAAL